MVTRCQILQNTPWRALRAIFLWGALLFASLSSASAQDRSLRVGEGAYAFDFQVFFRVNYTILEKNYMTNESTFARLDSVLAVHSTAAVDSVFLVAYASPEGGYKRNLSLAERRALSMRDYLVQAHPALDGKIKLDFAVQPWPRTREELAALRYAAFRLVFPYDITIANPMIDEFELDESYYVLTPTGDEDMDLSELAGFGEPLRPVVIPDYVTRYKQTVAAVKTNLLYDAVTALNVEVEVPVGDRISLMVEDVFPWWEYGNKYCFQHWEMGAEARYWFRPWDVHGTEKLRGFFAGLYGMSAKYDFQWDRSVNYQGEYWSAGISGGWCTPVGRTKWGNLELSLGLGYLYSDWRHYYPTDSYDKLIRDRYRVGNLIHWGPTKAKVSLVVPINVTRTRKGGSK